MTLFVDGMLAYHHNVLAAIEKESTAREKILAKHRVALSIHAGVAFVVESFKNPQFRITNRTLQNFRFNVPL